MRYFARFSIRYRNIRIRIFLFLLSENETCDNSGLINYPVGTQKLHLHFRRIRIYLYYIIHGGKNETNILFTLKFKILKKIAKRKFSIGKTPFFRTLLNDVRSHFPTSLSPRTHHTTISHFIL